MDRISGLHDELLVRILCLLPNTKEVVSTMVLSKRWQFLWMMVPRLVYDDSYQDMEYEKFSRFVDRSLALHEAPVVETMHFKIGNTCGTGDIKVWIRAADKCSLRELIIEVVKNSYDPVTLPRRLYSGGCKMLVTLKLIRAILVDDDVMSRVSFKSLKTLSLISMTYPSDDFVSRFLSSCVVLEDLIVVQHEDDNLNILSIRVPSLKSLYLHKPADMDKDNVHGLFIDAPSLECLEIVDYSYGFCVIEKNMSKIVEADVDIFDAQTQQLLDSITSVKRLYLCLPTSKDAYPVGSLFKCLVELKLCTCETEWVNLLMRLLRDSPYLQALKLEQCHCFRNKEARPCWNEPRSSVPECLESSLEKFEWVRYLGTEEEKQVAAFILRSASNLKKATIIPKKTIDSDKKLKMLMELSLSPRRSPTCQLEFI